MKLEQSQLDYLSERGGNYDRKYKMFELLLDEIPNQLNVVLELFGGVGIQSYYLQQKKKITNHMAIDQDERCNDIAKSLMPCVNRINKNCFDYLYEGKIDLLVCDSVFNNKEFDNIVGLINKFDFDYLILTNTGVFNVRFNKQISYEQYWNTLVNHMADYGLYVNNIIYSCDFGLMLVRKIKMQDIIIKKLEHNNISRNWRGYIKEIKNENI